MGASASWHPSPASLLLSPTGKVLWRMEVISLKNGDHVRVRDDVGIEIQKRTGQCTGHRISKDGNRGHPKQHLVTNLLMRLQDFRDAIWRFVTAWRIPFKKTRRADGPPHQGETEGHRWLPGHGGHPCLLHQPLRLGNQQIMRAEPLRSPAGGRNRLNSYNGF